jgi:hypothetical protein
MKLKVYTCNEKGYRLRMGKYDDLVFCCVKAPKNSVIIFSHTKSITYKYIYISNNTFVYSLCVLFSILFSSPDVKAELFWSTFVYRPSVWRIRLLHFQLLQNCWTNCNQSWHKSSLGKGNSKFFIWRTTLFFKGRYNSEREKKIHWRFNTMYNATCGGRDRCRAGSVIFKRRK